MSQSVQPGVSAAQPSGGPAAQRSSAKLDLTVARQYTLSDQTRKLCTRLAEQEGSFELLLFEDSLLFWEVGPAALKRLNYLKAGFRVQAGRWLTIDDTWAVQTAIYVLAKPGFKDEDGGAAVEFGFKLEILTR